MLRATPNAKGMERLRRRTQALAITDGDLRGPVLVRLGQAHRKQQQRIFSSEGAAGGAGPWAPLNPDYEQRKRKLLGRRAKLVLTGRMRARFLTPSDPNYIQEYVATSRGRGVFRFGARSDVAAAHLYGQPELASTRSAAAQVVFGGRAKRLPVRNMIAKTGQQIAELREVVVRWYREERVPQALRGGR